MPDPNFTTESCLSINHGPSPQWWLSPDVVVNGFDGVPVPSGARTVNVTTRCGAGGACTGLAGQAMRVELWVGNPSLVMDKTDPTATKRIGLLPQFIPAAGGSSPVPFPWTVPASGTGPESPGHKCLIGLVYPSGTGLTPDPINFYPSDDAHYAQKNLCIVTCSSPCGQNVQTISPNREKVETTIIRAVADPKPSKQVLAAILPALKEFKGFKRLSPNLPPPFRLMLEGFHDVHIAENCFLRPRVKTFGGMRFPNVVATIQLKPKQPLHFRITTDLEKVPLGDAFIIHLTHESREQVRGGLTVVFVKVRGR